jgi:hypothetical protein
MAANYGTSLNCRDGLCNLCTGCRGCTCHAVPAPPGIKAMARALAERSRAARQREAAELAAEHEREMSERLLWTA